MIVLWQFGFCCIWLVSNSANLSMVAPHWNETQRLWLQLPVLFPLVWIRHLRLFAVTNSIGIIFTVGMVVYFFFFMSDRLATFGAQPVQLVNTGNFDMLL